MQLRSDIRKGVTFNRGISLFFRAMMAVITLVFLFGEQLSINKGYTGLMLLKEGLLFNPKGFILYGVLFFGSSILGFLASKGGVKILSTGLQIAFFFLIASTGDAFEVKLFGNGFKWCFLLTAFNFIAGILCFMSERNGTEEKDLGISILLTIFLGPLGLFYASRKGAIIMCFVSAAVFMLHTGILTAVMSYSINTGMYLSVSETDVLSYLPLLSIPLVCTIWGVIAVNKFNQKLLSDPVVFS